MEETKSKDLTEDEIIVIILATTGVLFVIFAVYIWINRDFYGLFKKKKYINFDITLLHILFLNIYL
jgi:hypothetical protein